MPLLIYLRVHFVSRRFHRSPGLRSPPKIKRPRIFCRRSPRDSSGTGGVCAEGASAGSKGRNASLEGGPCGLSLNVGAFSRRVTRTLVAGTSSTLTVEAGGIEGGLGVAIDDDPPSRPPAGDSGGIGRSAIGAAFSLVEVLGRPRGRPICPASVIGVNLRPLVSALLDEASTPRLLRRSISERSGRIRPEGRGAPGSATGALTFPISAAVEDEAQRGRSGGIPHQKK